MSTIRTFIVHGHDRGLAYELKDYLQNTLGIAQPIVLEQQPDGGRTIIEKFEDHVADIDIAFVLLTPDDSMGQGTARARQNVIFELGYFLGKLGRRSGRVILIYKADVDIPTDLNGVVYIPVTKTINEAGERIRREIDNVIAGLR